MSDMASAPMPGPEFHEVYPARAPQGITIERKRDRMQAGSCNACTEIVNNPNAYSTVTVLNLRGLSVRLCPTCLSTLKKAL